NELKKLQVAARPQGFDGYWQVHRVSASCVLSPDIRFVISVTKDTVAGEGSSGQKVTGKISTSGQLKFSHSGTKGVGIPDGSTIHYDGSLRGNTGSGTFYRASSRCKGTFTATRSPGS